MLQVIEKGIDHRKEQILLILAKEPRIATSDRDRIEHFMVILV